MKIKIFLSALMVLLTSLAFTQTYTEIFEGGWGQGMRKSNPFFMDIDNDGLLDMIVGEGDGNLNHYEQDAVGSASFTLASQKFNGIDVGAHSAPYFTDLDSDGLLDMIVGEFDGNLNRYEQDAVGSASFTLVSDNFNGIDVGDESTPCFTDLDNDGLLDMIVGEFDGNLNHYEQDAVGSASFTLVSEKFNRIDVGYWSAPCFTDLDNDGLLDMIVGERDDNLNHYEQDVVGSASFTLVSQNFNGIDVGDESTPCFTDLDNDGLLDMIFGEYKGNLNHYEQDAARSASFTLVSENFNGIDVGVDSTPCFTDLDSDGLLDMIVGERDGNLNHYEQDAIGSASFTLVSQNFNGIDVRLWSTPCFTDLDNDGLLDMIVGERDGNLNHYEQDAVGSASFTLVSENFNGIWVGLLSAPCFTDLDNDGLLDMIVGESDGFLNHYEQDAVGSASFTLVSENFNGIDVGDDSKPCFTDLDNDGLLNMIVGESDGYLNHYEQDAVGSASFTMYLGSFMGINVSYTSAPCFTDLDNDGLLDMIVGEWDGGIHYFQRNEVDEVYINHPSFELLHNYPNPFNSSTTIRFQLPNPDFVSLKIYDLRGRKIETLMKENCQPGEYEVQWNPENIPSGIYLYHLEVGEYVETKKMVLQK